MSATMDIDLIYKALANPFRRDVLEWLKTPTRIFEQRHFDLTYGVPPNLIHAHSGLSQSTVSAHLATLVAAGLLVATRQGQWTFLSRNEHVIRAFARQVSRNL
jgi:DNA-binding transcriptional ArsR family regulator